MTRKVAQEAKMARRRAASADSFLGTLRTLVHDLFNPYRPELHYMRGPGPKWHAKHAPASVQAPVTGPGLRQAAI